MAGFLQEEIGETMKSIHFPATKSPPAAELPVHIADFLRNAGAAACCHPTLEGAGLSSLCAYLGATNQLAEGESGLGGLMASAYADMAISPSFMLTGSAVPFCLSAEPKGGHYFLHVPRGADSSTPVLLLLHGYGGNLLYFPWAVWKAVPEFILIAPSWQINWSEGSFARRRGYVEAAMAHAADKIGVRLQKPWLVPLSQGGPVAFELAGKSPKKFSGLLGISTFGDPEGLNLRDFPVRLLHGDADGRIPYKIAQEAIRLIKRAGGDAKITVVPGADHFLLLSHRKHVEKFLRENISV